MLRVLNIIFEYAQGYKYWQTLPLDCNLKTKNNCNNKTGYTVTFIQSTHATCSSPLVDNIDQ